jgi:hypothetical protein
MASGFVKEGIQETAAEADRAYPEVAKFIKLDAPELELASGWERVAALEGAGRCPGDSSEWTVTRPSESNKPIEVDSRPMILDRPQPVYTPETRKNNIQGTVTLRRRI